MSLLFFGAIVMYISALWADKKKKELDEKLAQPALRQLRQRVELRHTILPLSLREAVEYVRERLLIAGHDTGDLFTVSSLRAAYRYSGGIPRVINVLCDMRCSWHSFGDRFGSLRG